MSALEGKRRVADIETERQIGCQPLRAVFDKASNLKRERGLMRYSVPFRPSPNDLAYEKIQQK